MPPCPSPSPGVHSDSCPSSRWCHPAISSSIVPFSSCPQLLPASVFSNESTLHMRWPKYWSFSFSIIPFKEHPGLISFRMDWLDLLAVQGTHNSLLQHHSSKASIYSRETIVFSTSCPGGFFWKLHQCSLWLLIFTRSSQCAKYLEEGLICIISFNFPDNHLWERHYFYATCKWGKWGLERISTLKRKWKC